MNQRRIDALRARARDRSVPREAAIARAKLDALGVPLTTPEPRLSPVDHRPSPVTYRPSTGHRPVQTGRSPAIEPVSRAEDRTWTISIALITVAVWWLAGNPTAFVVACILVGLRAIR